MSEINTGKLEPSYIFIFLPLCNKDLVKQMIPKELCLTTKVSIPRNFRINIFYLLYQPNAQY
jgi:hypothetical protein